MVYEYKQQLGNYMGFFALVVGQKHHLDTLARSLAMTSTTNIFRFWVGGVACTVRARCILIV